MDVDEYAREVKPHYKRSKLLAFKDQIRELKHKGFSDMQVRDWLAQNGIQVSRENVRKFIKRHLVDLDESMAEDKQQSPATNETMQNVGNENSPETQQPENTKESPAERLRRLAQEQRDEADKRRFSHDKTGNNH